MMISKYVGIKVIIVVLSDVNMYNHLLLSQDQHSLFFDGVVRCQIFTAAPHHSILEGLPHPVAGGPCDAEVMPFSIIDEERQLCNLQQRQFHFSIRAPLVNSYSSHFSSRVTPRLLL